MSNEYRKAIAEIILGERDVSYLDSHPLPEQEADSCYNLLLDIAWRLRANGVGPPVDAKFVLAELDEVRALFPEVIG